MIKYRIAEGLTVRCAKERRLKELSFFYILKYKYSSGCIHHYSPYNVSKRWGGRYSRTKVDRHVKLFLKWHWCYIKDGHLFFKSNDTIQTRSKDRKIVCRESEVLPMLKAILIDRKKRQCMFSMKARNDQSSTVRRGKQLSGSKSQKLTLRLSKVKNKSGALQRAFLLGSTKLGNVLGCGRSMASVNRMKMDRMGILFVRKSKPKFIKRCTRAASFVIRDSYKNKVGMFWRNGVLWQQPPNEYNIPFFVWKDQVRMSTNFSQSSSNKKAA